MAYKHQEQPAESHALSVVEPNQKTLSQPSIMNKIDRKSSKSRFSPNRNQAVTRTGKYLTKKILREVAQEGDRIGFNRQIEPSILETITDERMPAIFAMVHEHIAMKKVAPHVRCRVVFRLQGDAAVHDVYIDMTQERYDSLPSISL